MFDQKIKTQKISWNEKFDENKTSENRMNIAKTRIQIMKRKLLKLRRMQKIARDR